MAAANVDFIVVDNEDFTSPQITILNADGSPHNLTGGTLRFQVRTEQGADGSPLLDLTAGAGITIVSAAGGVIQIIIARFALDKGSYWQDLIEERSSKRTAVFAGTFSVTNGVTRW
jgi:hypothetical protein